MEIDFVSREDLLELKMELIKEIKEILNEKVNGGINQQWLRSADVRKLMGISAGTLQNFRIVIQDDHLPTFIDLIHQIKELTVPGSGRKLLKSDYDSPYYKLISKYFSHQGKDIPINTARNYFVQKSAKDATKGSKIPEDKKLFSITPRMVKD